VWDAKTFELKQQHYGGRDAVSMRVSEDQIVFGHIFSSRVTVRTQKKTPSNY